MKKFLITGATGMVGSDVSAFLSNKYVVYAGTIEKNMQIKNCEMVFLDITNKARTMQTLIKIRPDYVIHLAALTDVNLCEKNKKLARKINIEGTKNITLASEKIGAKLIYASTNYVFDGKKGMYTEQDIPNPVNFYSLTKLEGERQVLKYNNSIVTRICPFGLGRKNHLNFTTWIIKNLSENKKINLFTDQFFSPISTYNYAEALIKILKSDFTGLINIAGPERLSRYEFAKKVADVFSLDANLLNPIKIEDLNEDAKRPRDTSLDISKARSFFGDIFLDVTTGLNLIKN